MLETAYVLPLVLGVMLFIVEVVAFAMNSFAANDVLTDVHSAILSEVSGVSNLAVNGVLDPPPLYASCDGKSVVLPVGENLLLTNHIKSALEVMGVSFNTDYAVTASITVAPVTGFNVYVINFNAVPNSLVLSGALGAFLPINVDTVISIKDSCTS